MARLDHERRSLSVQCYDSNPSSSFLIVIPPHSIAYLVSEGDRNNGKPVNFLQYLRCPDGAVKIIIVDGVGRLRREESGPSAVVAEFGDDHIGIEDSRSLVFRDSS